jgi:hypothetical protein
MKDSRLSSIDAGRPVRPSTVRHIPARPSRWIIPWALAALVAAAPAAAQINVNIAVPAASPYLADWEANPSVVMLLITNTLGSDVQATVRLRFLLNNAVVGTVASPITTIPGDSGPAGPVLRLNNYGGGQIASWTQTQIVGAIAQAYQSTGRLPEGSYQLCVDLSNMSVFGRPLPDVSNCTAFMITYPQPPILVAPPDGNAIVTGYPTLQWTPVVVPGRAVSYLLRVVEVLPGQTPLKAIEADVPVLDTVITSVTALTYPPTALPLETGKTYAWRVQAVNALGSGDFAGGGPGVTVPVGANEGRSQVFTFTKKVLIKPVQITTSGQSGPSGKANPSYAKQPPLFNASLAGTLQYTFDPAQVPEAHRIKPYNGGLWGGMGYTASGLPAHGYTSGQRKQQQNQQQGGPPHLRSTSSNFPARQPLAGMSVKLVVRYRSDTDPVNAGSVSAGGTIYDDVDQVVATATTDQTGHFLFLFHDDRPTGQVALMQPLSWGSGEIGSHHEAHGNLYRFYQLEIEDGHYLNPSDELTLSQSKTGDIGTLVSLVRSYTLRLRLLGVITHDVLQGARVQLIRVLRPPHIPKDEGEAKLPRPSLLGLEIIGEHTAGVDGWVTFHRLVKNVGVGDKYVIRVTIDSTSDFNYKPRTLTYANAWELKLGPHAPAYDDANFNEAYDVGLTAADTVWLMPLAPAIAGRVYRADNSQPMPNATALVVRVGGTFASRTIVPKDSGRFVVAGVKEAKQPPFYSVVVLSKGFKGQGFDTISVKLGRKWYHTFYLQPDARIHAQFVDEKGHPVQAWIKVGDGPLMKSRLLPGVRTAFGQRVSSGAFVVDTFATSGAQEPVHIEAPNFFDTDTTLTIPKGNADLGTFVLISRKHRLRVVVRRGAPRAVRGGYVIPGLPAAPTVPGAPVRVDVVDSVAGVTGRDGSVVLEWSAVGTATSQGAVDSVANLHIASPANADYVATPWTCKAPERPTPFVCDVYLEPGTRVAGKVYVGKSDSTPVAGARVFLPDHNDIDATTGPDGSYVLRSVPLTEKLMRAGKAGSGFIGDSQNVALKAPQVAGVDFHLADPQAMHLPKTLLGFPLEVNSATPLANGGGAIVTGQIQAPASGPFAPAVSGAVQQTVALPFDSVRLRPATTGGTLELPAGDTLLLAKGDLLLRLYGKYSVRQSALSSGLIVREKSDGVGAVYGTIELLRQESFTGTSSTGLSFIDAGGKDAPLFLLLPGASGAARSTLASLGGDAAAVVPSGGWNVGAADGGPAHFRLAANAGQAGFPVDGDAAQSFVRDDGIHFHATVHTDISGIGDLALSVPDLLLKPGSGGLGTTGSSDTLTLKLDQWTLNVQQWSLSDAGIDFAKGEVRAPLLPNKPASAVVFPFTAMRLLPNGLSGGTFQADAVKLGGVVTLKPPSTGLQFAREASGPWKLTALGGTIAGLPGFGAGDAITLDNWSLRSNGSNEFSPKNGTKVRLFDTADFRVSSITVADGVVRFPGTLDLLAPSGANIPPVGSTIFYSPGPGGQPVFGMEKANWTNVDIGGAILTISDGQLDASGLHAGGSIRVPDNFTVATTFTRTPLHGTNRLTATPAPNATIAIGEMQVANVKGGASFGSSWDTKFTGHLDIPNQAAADLSFGVAGTGVTVGTAGIQMNNISTPFGDVVIKLNAAQQRLEGSLQVDKDIAAGAHAQGTAQLVISGKPGNRYWYFFTGANISLSSPSLAGTAALLFGNAQLQGDILASFSSYSTKGVPPAFYNIDGFFLDGKVVIPVPICPSGGFDIGVASVAVWCNAWGDLRLGMNFQEHNTYHVGLQTGIDVGAKGGVSLGACISISGEASYEQGAEGEYRSDGAWYVLGDANFNLHGDAEYGVGALGVCLSDHKSFNLGLGAEAQLGYNWNTKQGPHFRVSWQ